MFDAVARWALSADVAAIVGWASLIVGIAGLGLTIAVYRSTSAIRGEFLVTARVPKQLEDLRACATSISESLGRTELEVPALRREVARLGEIALSIKHKMGGGSKDIASLMDGTASLARQFEETRTSEHLLNIYVSAQRSIEALAQWLQDRDWSAHNAN